MSLYQEKRSGPSCFIRSVNVLTPVDQSAILKDKNVIACSLVSLAKNSWRNSSSKLHEELGLDQEI